MARCRVDLPRLGTAIKMRGGGTTEGSDDAAKVVANRTSSRRSPRYRRWLAGLVWSICAVSVAFAATAYLATKASAIDTQLNSANELVPNLQKQISQNESEQAAATVEQIRLHTSTAKDAANDPLWTLASNIPWLGANFSAVAEVARSADDVASLGLAPLVGVYSSLNWDALLPTAAGTDLQPLKAASPSVSSAAHAVRVSAERLDGIDESRLLRQIAEPLKSAREQLGSVTGALDAAASAAEIVPGMLGTEAPRNYLLMIQNNAESRATGGIPGALAVLNLDAGKLSLGAQSSAGEVGIMSPVLASDPEQQQIYSGRLGKFMQDVNLTPDFPSAASMAQTMWEKQTGQRVDGVISVDPVALSYILDATGPVRISNPGVLSLASEGLPTELDGRNVVATMLSDVYAKIDDPQLQDAYFAGVAQEIFGALSSGRGDAKALIEGMTRGVGEGRVLVWSSLGTEQSVIGNYPVSGSVAGPSVSAAQFGLYFNDGTGAKMDYYVKRTVKLIKECAKDGYEQTTVRVSSTNTAPADAATSLPAYVTGGGIHGVPAGSVQTNIVAYGPVQANVETAKLDGQKTPFAPYLHSNRPVGVLAVRLAPGETKTVEFTFGKIVQHTEPNLFVTPTVQPVKDVTLATEIVNCG